jgi:hypothetical protein
VVFLTSVILSVIALCAWNLDVSFSYVEFSIFGDSSEWVVIDDSGHLHLISTTLNQFGALFEKC